MSVDSEPRIGQKSKDFVAKADKSKEHKGKPPTIGERLLSRKAGAYWIVEELTAIGVSREQSVEMRRRAEYSLEDIEKYGKDALSHLCLEGYFHNALRRSGITVISALEELLRNGRKSAIKDGDLSGIISTQGMQVVSGRLDLFHQRVAKEQQAKPRIYAKR